MSVLIAIYYVMLHGLFFLCCCSCDCVISLHMLVWFDLLNLCAVLWCVIWLCFVVVECVLFCVCVLLFEGVFVLSVICYVMLYVLFFCVELCLCGI